MNWNLDFYFYYSMFPKKTPSDMLGSAETFQVFQPISTQWQKATFADLDSAALNLLFSLRTYGRTHVFVRRRRTRKEYTVSSIVTTTVALNSLLQICTLPLPCNNEHFQNQRKHFFRCESIYFGRILENPKVR